VTGNPGPTAAEVTVSETLEILDGQFAPLSEGVAEGSYAIWIGSGISRSSVDGLQEVIPRVLIHLQDQISVTDPDCRFRKALNEALDLANLSTAQRLEIQLDTPFDEWECAADVVRNLVPHYSKLLDIRIPDTPADYLTWEAVDVVRTFGQNEIQPDCEHICLAVLALEGVLPEIASANWDGLIEAAIIDIYGHGVLGSCVSAEELREPQLRSRLLKFHGCAVKATENEAEFRKYIVARQSQITDWRFSDLYGAMRTILKEIAQTKKTLMIGLSAQDTNIQEMFAEAQNEQPWPWPTEAPAFAFSEETVGFDQLNILKIAYKDAYDEHSQEIETSAHLRAYAKPLLVALVLCVITKKLVAYLRHVGTSELSSAEWQMLSSGIHALRDLITSIAIGDLAAFCKSLVRAVSHGMAQFQHGVAGADGIYSPIGSVPINQIPHEPHLSTSGVPELAFALGLIGLGHAEGIWTVSAPGSDDLTRSPILIHSSAGPTRVYFAANADAAVRLGLNQAFETSDKDVVVMHSMTPPRAMQRSPDGAPGRTGLSGPREVDIRGLLVDNETLLDIQQGFREAASL
jgi:hypothetical protein